MVPRQRKDWCWVEWADKGFEVVNSVETVCDNFQAEVMSNNDYVWAEASL